MGTHFLVLELVPGETLTELFSRGPLAFAEALPLFRQIAEATPDVLAIPWWKVL